MRFLAAFLLLTSCVFADVKAVITGPETGNPGDLVVLRNTDAIGDNFKWITPKGIQTLECSGALAFATGTPGTYSFLLVAADKEAAIDVATHTVVIGKPTTPDPPPPTPATDFAKISKDLAPDEPAIAAKIVENIKATTEFLQNNQLSVQQAAALYQTNIGNALALRPRGSQADWLTWRKALEKEFQNTSIKDLDVLISAYNEIAKGLQ